MTGLTVEITTKEDAERFVRDNDAEVVLALLLYNQILQQRQCECRLDACQSERKRSRIKNAAMQVSGGMTGGAVALYAIWLAARDYIVAAVAEYLRKAGG